MIRLVQYRTWQKVRNGHNSCVRSALVKDGGRKWLQVVILDASADGGLRLSKVPLADEKHMKPLMLRGKPYPITLALKTFRKLAKSHGCTKGAKKLLKEASKQCSS